ncbi:hypothetical protein K9O30_02935 [Clostridium bowmanii]|uniref:hypothetical protein n=1 Tax=Clostridium bowmanii TaxID=132925 RepID=UPI001C0BFDA9|nr:hypothetical protein [Clostridium bowmanii]MBU3188320.1 hypothetical protein [Clostridium bowmanii]MCA1072708.1 hypothetical protein [Clostridium bowmanii]
MLIFIFSFYLLPNIVVVPEATNLGFKTKVVSAQTLNSVKVSSSVNNKTPLQNLIVKVTVNGPAKGSVKIICHYKSTNTTYKATIGLNGKAVIPVKISCATKGYNERSVSGLKDTFSNFGYFSGT